MSPDPYPLVFQCRQCGDCCVGRGGIMVKPDEVEITFGLKASGELGSLVIAKAGVEANYSVKLTWKKAEQGSRARPRSVHRSSLRS